MTGAQDLQTTLAELREQLEGAPDLDAESRQALEAAAAEILRALAGEGEGEEAVEGDSLQDRLASAIERFEESHPQLTAVVGRVADALAELGI